MHKLLAESGSSLKFEYEISHPVLHYFWGVKQFLETDFADCVLRAESTAEQRADYLEALTNSTARIFDWLAVRHALLTKRARTPKGHENHLILEHYQNEVYAFVGSAPPTSAWLDNMETAFQDKVFVAELKSLRDAGQASENQGSSHGDVVHECSKSAMGDGTISREPDGSSTVSLLGGASGAISPAQPARLLVNPAFLEPVSYTHLTLPTILLV